MKVVTAAANLAGWVRLGLARAKEAGALLFAFRANVTAGAGFKAVTSSARPVAAIMPEVPLVASEHWARVARVVTVASEQTRNIHDMQRTAASQLDAAGYAIEEIMYDLSAAGLLPQLVRAPALARPLPPRSSVAAVSRAGMRPAA